MLATGALSYLVAPLWLGFVALGLWFGAFGASSAGLWLLTLLLLFLPRLLGVLAVQLRGEQAAVRRQPCGCGAAQRSNCCCRRCRRRCACWRTASSCWVR